MEYELHKWLQERFPPVSDKLIVGIGDDAAVVKTTGLQLVFTTDTIAEGAHFLLPDHSLEAIGHKAIGVNLSDIAAMGATPTYALLSLILPRKFDLANSKRLIEAMTKTASQLDVTIIGGDTNSWDGKLVVGATLVGAIPNDRQPWRKSGAEVGDCVLVSGCFGGSIHGRHLNFEPRVKLAQHIADNYLIHAATDVSDSLSLDLNSIALASQVGIELDLESIPISPDVQAEEATQRLECALNDGEDFELVLCASAGVAEQLLNDSVCSGTLTKIGIVTDGSGLSSRVDNQIRKIEPKGFIH